MPPFSLFWGWGVSYNSIFRDVLFRHDPANECLVTGLFRIPSQRFKTLFGAATTGLFWSSSRKPEGFLVSA
jgi:hypothetical protein